MLIIQYSEVGIMKTGEFAQKHGITQDTIRHYLDLGLLVTKKNGSQYNFSETDSNDLNLIMELKKLDFTLIEIQKILAFKRLSGENTEDFRNLYLSLLEEKMKEVNDVLHQYNKMNTIINKKIIELKKDDEKKNNVLGFPMRSLGILTCPVCHNSLDVSEGTIENNMIDGANIKCACGYKALISKGIYVDETSIRTRKLNGKRVPTKAEYLSISSPGYINFLYKAMYSIIDNIRNYGDELTYIMELDSCVGFFLLQYIKYLPPNTTYILIDNDLDQIAKLKQNLEMYNAHKNFIFFCCDIHNIPLSKSSVNIIVDYGMITEYEKSTGKFLLNRILPLLKQDGIYTVAYSYYGSNSKSKYKIEPRLIDIYNRDNMLKKINETCLKKIDLVDIGPVIENNPYNIDIEGMEIYQAVYTGKKIEVS